MDRLTKLNFSDDNQTTRVFNIDKEYTKKCEIGRSCTRVKIYIIYLIILASVALPIIFPDDFNSGAALLCYMFASSFIFPVIASTFLFFLFGEDVFPNSDVAGLIGTLKALLASSAFVIPVSVGFHQTSHPRIPMYINLLFVYEMLVFIYILKKDYKKGIDNTRKLIAKDFKIDLHSKTHYEDINTIISDINRLIR